MTRGRAQFITPHPAGALRPSRHTDLLDPAAEAAMGHIELARWADLVLIAPATADLMARLARGVANDLLTTVVLATNAPVALAPAMNEPCGPTRYRPIVSSCWRVAFACSDPAPAARSLRRHRHGAHARSRGTGARRRRLLRDRHADRQASADHRRPHRKTSTRCASHHQPQLGKMGFALAEAAAEAWRAGHHGDRPGVPAHSRSCAAHRRRQCP